MSARKRRQDLFNSKGEWIAFRVGRYVFDNRLNWIGYLPWDDDEVVSADGFQRYYGHIHPGDRFYRLSAHATTRPYDSPPVPAVRTHPKPPSSRLPMFRPPGAEDLPLPGPSQASH